MAVPRHEHVRGLDVAMQLAVAVERRDTPGELPERAHQQVLGVLGQPSSGQRRRREAGRPPDVVREVQPVHERHREEARALADEQLVELDQVWVRDAGEGAELLLDVVNPLRIEVREGL